MKENKKAAVIGHFGKNKNFLNGQTVKTKIVAQELIKRLGDSDVTCIDTYGGMKATPKILLKCFFALKNHNNIVILPAQNGLRVVVPWLCFVNKFFKRKLHYVVIGGWLSEFLKDKKSLAKNLKKFDGIYVETTSMQKNLEQMGFENIIVMPNCKKLDILKEDELVYPDGEPYKLCTFSRVMKEKGIEDAVNAVKEVNEKLGRTVYTLDIYGQVDAGQTDWFEELKASFPEYVKYGGLVPFDKSVEVLKNYFALLFPTRFYTEGIPGTFIDAYAAGVPVITALWMNSADIFEDGVQGYGYEFGKTDELRNVLIQIAGNTTRITCMKPDCITKAKDYLPETVIKLITQKF